MKRKGFSVALDPSRARALALRAQGLDRRAAFGLGQEGVLGAIEHLGYVQIDTISVVERAHHHVLWSRVPDYHPDYLAGLHGDRQVYEYWSHAASFLPMKDFRHSLPLMKSWRRRFHWSEDSPELRSAMRRVLGRIRREGAVRSRDFEGESRPGFWTFSKIEKRALHELWMRGELMISAREGFQKVYDLRERVVSGKPAVPREAENADFLIARTLRAHGVIREPEIRYLQRGAFGAVIRRRLERAVKSGQVMPVRVGEVEAYALPETLAQDNEPVETRVHILSPFDNLVIQRERLRWLFGFDYQIECYVPAPKRRYGHFVLPVLYGDRFAARLEAKALRKESTLVLTDLWFEPGCDKDRGFRRTLREELERFAAFNQCAKLETGKLLSRRL